MAAHLVVSISLPALVGGGDENGRSVCDSEASTALMDGHLRGPSEGPPSSLWKAPRPSVWVCRSPRFLGASLVVHVFFFFVNRERGRMSDGYGGADAE